MASSTEPPCKRARAGIEILQPDDWHHHFRDGDVLRSTVPYACSQFARAIAMPNLVPPVTTTDMALAYRERILAQVPPEYKGKFQPLMTLYLTNSTPPEEIVKAKASGHVYAVKLYPKGATTNSHGGVTNIDDVIPTLQTMEKVGMPLLVHGEVTDPAIDFFDRESTAISQWLKPLVQKMPGLKMVMEHITTSEAVEFVTNAPDNVAATITPQHLLFNRNALFQGGIKPHFYCLPILKRETHRQALVKAISSGSPKFFLGTDSAPHSVDRKESSCGCAGCFSSPIALELYMEAFADANAVENFEKFCSVNGPTFYGLPVNSEKACLHDKPQSVPESYDFGDLQVKPLRSGETLQWTFKRGNTSSA